MAWIWSPKNVDDAPWKDPRALGISIAFHVVLLIAASFLALGLKMPASPPQPSALIAEIGAVDNKAPNQDAGGSPGALGGTADEMHIAAESVSKRGKAESAADSLIADALSVPRTASTEKAPVGPSTTGLGLLEGPGSGGGGGSGGGSGGGVGRGIGPGTEFFGAEDHAS